MFDLRYHVASLAAVFVALLIGILVGVGMSGKVDDAEKTKLKADVARLDAQLDAAGARRANRAREQEAGRAVVKNGYPLLIADRLLKVTPAEAEAGLDRDHHDQALTAGPTQEPGCAAAGDFPASALGQTTAIRPDRRVPRPPVGEVTRLGQERPDVATRREELSLRFDPHRP